MKKHITQIHLSRVLITSPFFLSPITFFCTSNQSIPFTHKYPKPLNLGEMDLRLVLLAWLPCRASLSIWLPAHWAIEPGTVTLISTFHRVSVKIKD